jgi:hypothetical protein
VEEIKSKKLLALSLVCMIVGLAIAAYGYYQDMVFASTLDNEIDETQQNTTTTQTIVEGPAILIDVNHDGVINWKDVDVDNSGQVNLNDAVAVLRAYGSKVGDAKYNVYFDFNGDGYVYNADTTILKEYYGAKAMSIYDIQTTSGQFFICGIAIFIVGICSLPYTVKKAKK